MNKHTAQCPACRTRFRVEEAQLTAAEGLLRCGQCQMIFHARWQDMAAHSHAQQDSAERSDLELVGQDDLAEDDDPLALLNSLSTVNHDFEHHQPAPTPPRWPWAAGIGVALLALLLQTIWWQMPSLMIGTAGPALTRLCEQLALSCRPPTATPVAQPLSTQKLVVRKHPTQADALVVDALLINNSNRAQALPALWLQFNDLNGRPVAGRVFQPQEYLSGELSSLTEMAAKQPIHVILEIRDPGNSAVNYQLHLVPQSG